MTTRTDLSFATLVDLRHDLDCGSITAQDILDSVLERIKRLDSKTNSFISLAPEETLREQADELGKVKSHGEVSLPLSGIPIAIKDNTFVRGIRCTCGSKVLESFVPERDALAISRLRNAGAIIIGKTNLHEFARGVTNVNAHFGTARNPWNLECISGGSSGGSAVALASGYTCVATGTDTGGSIRLPSALCGVVGLKPTYDKIPRDGVIPLSWSLDHVGPMSRSVDDAMILECIMAGEDTSKSTMKDLLESKESAKQLDSVRIGVPRNIFDNMQGGVASLFDRALGKFHELGASIIDVSMPYFEFIRPSLLAITMAEGTSVHEKWAKNKFDLYGEDLKRLIQIGYSIPATHYLRAMRFRGEYTERVKKIFTKVDVLTMPTVPSTAPRIGDETVKIGGREFSLLQTMTMFTSMFNLTGMPAISIPMGYVDGLPAAIQLATDHYREDLIFRTGRAFEKAEGFKIQRPQL